MQELHINKVGELSDWPNGFFDQEQYDLISQPVFLFDRLPTWIQQLDLLV
ncbi:DUF3696 domain-containing protein [Peribacillus frigoritolerans]